MNLCELEALLNLLKCSSPLTRKRIEVKSHLSCECDKCGHEFDNDDFPDEGFACPECGATDGTFSIIG